MNIEDFYFYSLELTSKLNYNLINSYDTYSFIDKSLNKIIEFNNLYSNSNYKLKFESRSYKGAMIRNPKIRFRIYEMSNFEIKYEWLAENSKLLYNLLKL